MQVRKTLAVLLVRTAHHFCWRWAIVEPSGPEFERSRRDLVAQTSRVGQRRPMVGHCSLDVLRSRETKPLIGRFWADSAHHKISLQG